MRIGKYLSRAGVCSRREAADFIQEHRVEYGGELIKRPDFDVNENEEITIDGKSIKLNRQTRIILLNKPKGYVCSHREQKDKKSIFRLLPGEFSSFYFAGRLDEDSRGLVVLSNDGDLIYTLTHPSQKKIKLYIVRTSRPLSRDEQARLLNGVWDNGEKLKADRVTPLDHPAKYEMEIHTGQNRIIRRMIQKTGAKVADLCRIQMGEYQLEGIEEGEFLEIRG